MTTVQVNHNGRCHGHTYRKDKPFTVSNAEAALLVAALGEHIKVLEKTEEKPEEKEIKEKKDKMVRKNQVVTK